MLIKRPAFGRMNRGFTLVELLVVLFIMTLLTALATPLFSQMVKTSRVEKAVSAIFATLWEARSQAQNHMKPVGVFFGEDPVKLNPAPIAGVVPPKNQLQIWTCKYGGVNAQSTHGPYVDGTSKPSPDWYPYRFLEAPLLGQALSLPDGVRVSAGHYAKSGAKYYWSCPNYKKDSIGEIKRHQIVFGRFGGLVYYGSIWTYGYVLVWDEASGEHTVIQAGEQKCATRPRVVCRALTHINKVLLTDYRDLSAMIDAIPGDR